MRGLSALALVAAFSASTQAASADEPPASSAIAVIHPERGFIDDAFALLADSSALLYVNTDGATWSELRAVGLPKRAAAAGGRPAGGTPASAPAVTAQPGATTTLLAGLPLGVSKLLPLPQDRLLVVSRDDSTNLQSATLYSLRTRAAVALPGLGKETLGPATDIVLTTAAAAPAVVVFSRPAGSGGEYRILALHAETLKPLGQRSYRLHGDEGRVQTAQGSALPLYFIDDYLTMVAKHEGEYDKKRDIRKPDYLAYVDTLTGKVKQSRPIADPVAVMELVRLRGQRGESAFVAADAETQNIELLVARGQPDGPADDRMALKLPRPAAVYDAATLRYQRARPGHLLLSITVDPVNEQAVAQRRTAPDLIDWCDLDLSVPGAAQRLLTLPGNKRASAWVANVEGRLALLRKHKGFSRGGTDIEIYDLDWNAPPLPAP